MDVARTALRSAAAMESIPGSNGGAAAAISKLAPDVDVQELQRIGAQWTSKIAEVTKESFSVDHCSMLANAG